MGNNVSSLNEDENIGDIADAINRTAREGAIEAWMDAVCEEYGGVHRIDTFHPAGYTIRGDGTDLMAVYNKDSDTYGVRIEGNVPSFKGCIVLRGASSDSLEEALREALTDYKDAWAEIATHADAQANLADQFLEQTT